MHEDALEIREEFKAELLKLHKGEATDIEKLICACCFLMNEDPDWFFERYTESEIAVVAEYAMDVYKKTDRMLNHIGSHLNVIGSMMLERSRNETIEKSTNVERLH